MCLQPALEDAECLGCSDTGWQTVPDARSSDVERPVTNCWTTQWRCYESRRWRRAQPPSCADVTTWHSSFARYGGAVPCRQQKTSMASLNSIHSRSGNQWRSWSSGVMCSYFRAEQTSCAAAFITDCNCSLSSWFPGRPASVALP